MEKLFNGDKLYMLPSVTPLQCMGFVLAGEGDVIAVDSGTPPRRSFCAPCARRSRTGTGGWTPFS